MIDPCKYFNISLFVMSSTCNNILSQISLSDKIPSALKTINIGIGCFILGI